MKKPIQLKIVVWKEGRHHVAQCLNVDISSFGKTKKEALINIHEALELYFEDTSPKNLAIIEKPELAKLSVYA